VTPEAPPLLVVAGATATGKTGLSIRVAEALAADGVAAEIISADSRQVYRGLDIGTAKIPPSERHGIPHHGLDLAEPDEPVTLAAFADHARRALRDLAARDGVAILVGGTGLYLRAVARGIDTSALPSDAAVRARIEDEFATAGPVAIAERLAAIAPLRAAATDLRNPRRVIRALEIAELAGDGPPPAFAGYRGPVAWVGLRLDRTVHRAWIARRAREQFAAGLIDEARSLRERFDPGLPPFSAIGYREAWSVLDGKATIDEAIATDAQRNAAFAKRQRTWFRAEPEIEWLDAEDPAATLDTTLERARSLVEVRS
jgi:tRNA dimethylallyltransferase